MCGKKTTTTSTEHSQVTPTNPPWVTGTLQNLTTRVNDLANADPYGFVAPPNELQLQGAQGLKWLDNQQRQVGSAQGLFQGLMDTAAPQTMASTGTAASLLPNISAYMNPYTRQVVDSALADYDYGAGQSRAQTRLSGAAMDDTFGGSNYALLSSLGEGELARGRGQLSSQLLNSAWDKGTGLANLDADRQQQMSLANMSALNNASQFNAGAIENALGRQLAAGQALNSSATNFADSQLRNAAAQMTGGSQLRDIQQQYQTAPLSTLATLAGALGSLPLSLEHGEIRDGNSSSTVKESDPIGSFATLAGGLSTLMGIPFGAGTLGSVLGGALKRQSAS